MHGKPKYPSNFKNFDYVNPNAPKGGTVTLASLGAYDNFNRYALRGLTPAGIETLYDTLLVTSDDEAEVYYCLIANKIEYSDDDKWMIYHINPKATFNNGKPITANDVLFSYNKFFNEGVPQFKLYFKDNVKSIEVLDKYRIKMSLNNPDKEMLISLGTIKIFPKQYWENKNLGDPLLEPPLGSGPYKVKEYKMGEYIIYERVKDYWAKDLPVMKGQNNFDYIRYDTYRDQTVAFQAFKAGEFDYWLESTAKNWATMYTGSQFDRKYIIKSEIENQLPQHMQGFIFNIKRPIFEDRRVRMALNLVFDFEWMNKNLFYNQYTRTRSYFQNTDYEERGIPKGNELRILSKFKGKIPDEVFTKEFNPNKTDGSGNIRREIREALKILKDAGWEIKDQKMVNTKNGKPFEFEFLLYDQSYERIAIPFQANLEKLGIKMNIRTIDTTQFTNRLRNRDFDMIFSSYDAFYYPNSNLQDMWRSNFIDSTYNTAGVQDEVVDALVDGVLANQDNEKEFLDYSHALDRVLMWNYYAIPNWYLSKFRIAYWNKFSSPKIRPKYAVGFINTWWYDKAKDSKLPKNNTK